MNLRTYFGTFKQWIIQTSRGDIHVPNYERADMRRMEAKLLTTVLLLSVSVFSMSASAEGDDIIIESDMTWSDDMSLSQNVRVVNGGSLSLVDSHFTVSNNVQIFVDSSSSLRLVDSDITSDSAPGGLAGFGYCDEANM